MSKGRTLFPLAAVVGAAIVLAIVFTSEETVQPESRDTAHQQSTSSAIVADAGSTAAQGAHNNAATNPQQPIDDAQHATPPVDVSSVTKFPDVGKEFLKAVHAVPNEGGGMRVERVDPNSLYGKLGLMPGDIVHNLDSIYQPTAEQKQQGIHPFNRPEIHLEVIRAGQPVLLKVPAEEAIK